LVPVVVKEGWLDELRREIGELPMSKQRRFISQYGTTDQDCAVILADRDTGVLYEAAIQAGAEARTLTKQFIGIWNHLASAQSTTIGKLGIPAAGVAELVKLVQAGTISATAASQVAERMYQRRPDAGPSPLKIAEDLGLIQERDESAMQAWVDQAVEKNPQAVKDALGSNAKKAQAARGFLRGQIMKLSKGQADPRLAGRLIEKKLAGLGEQQ
jgi:aspartyl-tRNA(Asn)/glutamyl-tRNA(Gln) amidotransferase subunit B